ncbi:aminoglycoside adenylyltransferase domain-containing protein, partial [Mammaliicoccus sciuri]
KYDPDIASHIMNLWTHSVVIEGPEVENIFPKIKDSEFIDSIEDTLIDNVDAVMNLCRKHYYIRQGKLLSKYEGLTWAINEFPNYKELLLHIEALYTENKIELSEQYI